MDTPFRCTNGAYLISPVSTDQLVLSFQLTVSPNFKVHTDCSVECKIVYFGCG